MIVLPLSHHFGRQVVKRPTECLANVGCRVNAPAEVGELYLTAYAQHDILGLKVSMHHTPLVHMLDSKRHISHDVSCDWFREPPFGLAVEVTVEFAVWCIFENEVDLAAVPEVAVKR